MSILPVRQCRPWRRPPRGSRARACGPRRGRWGRPSSAASSWSPPTSSVSPASSREKVPVSLSRAPFSNARMTDLNKACVCVVNMRPHQSPTELSRQSSPWTICSFRLHSSPSFFQPWAFSHLPPQPPAPCAVPTCPASVTARLFLSYRDGQTLTHIARSLLPPRITSPNLCC